MDELQANSDRLNEGLKTCRTVVENYRSLLTGQPAGVADRVEHPNALNDNAN